MAKCDQLTGPMMRGRTGLDPDQARFKASKERNHLASPQAPARHDRAARIDGMNLENIFGEINADRDSLTHG